MEHKTICTPFNKTGYCKYGDACKYSHIRINTQSLENICPICRLKISSAVFTNCNHEYCKECITESKDALEKCVFCGEETHGIFYKK
ncbi:pre-mRNA-splicing factor (CWC24) [Vairimorpha necatrix]|uniref:Pre-mRNA-splicing factor CWC24 n=1 Tax=Vairimorpha necatrix TaxID=6039 RepID=A0AAX4J9F1_9MICR